MLKNDESNIGNDDDNKDKTIKKSLHMPKNLNRVTNI